MKKSRHQQGMTLIELLIAMVIGVFLLGGVIQIFINTKNTHRMQENLSRMQENGRFAMDFLAKDLRMTSFWGCRNMPVGDLAGADNNTNSTDNIDDGTDKIAIKGAFEQAVTGTCDTIVDTSADVFYTDASSSITYRIRDSVLERKASGGYRGLIEDVENMQIVYGMDTDWDPIADPKRAANFYVPAGTAGLNMERVVSVRINLLVRSMDDNLASQIRDYTFNGVTITPTDRRLRRTFSSTIALRNRLP